jgi:hypothetical protein
MTIQPGEFPVVIQAYQPSGNSDLFVAEQLIHNQPEADVFTSRYAGLLIKARKPNESEFQGTPTYAHTNVKTRSRGPGVGMILLLILVALIVVGFTTGWIQRNTGFMLN